MRLDPSEFIVSGLCGGWASLQHLHARARARERASLECHPPCTAPSRLCVTGVSFLVGYGTEREVLGGPEHIVDPRNITQLNNLWKGRRAGRNAFIAADTFEILGWLFVVPPVQ